MNAVFIHVPRTGGLYVQEVLGLELFRFPHRARNRFKQQGKVTFGHQFYRSLVRRGIVSREFDRSAFKFAFCRNPFDRAVSHYFYAKKKHPDILGDASFLEFTRNLSGYGTTFRPQSDFIAGIGLGFVGRFERLEQDVAFLAKTLGTVPWMVPPRNTTKHEPYWEYYVEDAEENIRNFYAEDFARFGYHDYLLYGQ